MYKPYAAHRRGRGLSGGTPKAVRKAFASGRLKGVAHLVAGQLVIPDFAAADRAWAANTSTDHYSAAQLKALEAQQRGVRAAPVAPETLVYEWSAAPAGSARGTVREMVIYEGPGGRIGISAETHAALLHADANPELPLITPELAHVMDRILDVTCGPDGWRNTEKLVSP